MMTESPLRCTCTWKAYPVEREVVDACCPVHGHSELVGRPGEPMADTDVLEAHICVLEDVLREFVEWFGIRFPTGQNKQLPGVTLFSIASRANAALGPQKSEDPASAGPPGDSAEG